MCIHIFNNSEFIYVYALNIFRINEYKSFFFLLLPKHEYTNKNNFVLELFRK